MKNIRNNIENILKVNVYDNFWVNDIEPHLYVKIWSNIGGHIKNKIYDNVKYNINEAIKENEKR